ncbi:MAG: UPF0175 family protein [Magnetococcales bacterium]|nr:UPF0175 family protein [Magnetococcales bacterium]MBF0150186.1 UPF0175 family protein [Magnetococcales bacterium]MBF0173452.1 UPF0175 family protein [Magnetococcales bacterium]MBF0348127.1 UPF0175 family protein [Magnetococcales bacterium]
MTVTMEIPSDMLSALRRSPDEFIQELRLSAAIQWYTQGWLAQSKASEFASVSRAEFLDELYKRRIPAVQVTEEELRKEVFGG